MCYIVHYLRFLPKNRTYTRAFFGKIFFRAAHQSHRVFHLTWCTNAMDVIMHLTGLCASPWIVISATSQYIHVRQFFLRYIQSKRQRSAFFALLIGNWVNLVAESVWDVVVPVWLLSVFLVELIWANAPSLWWAMASQDSCDEFEASCHWIQYQACPALSSALSHGHWHLFGAHVPRIALCI